MQFRLNFGQSCLTAGRVEHTHPLFDSVQQQLSLKVSPIGRLGPFNRRDYPVRASAGVNSIGAGRKPAFRPIVILKGVDKGQAGPQVVVQGLTVVPPPGNVEGSTPMKVGDM